MPVWASAKNFWQILCKLRKLDAFFVLFFSTTFVTRATACRMVSVCIAKLMLSHFSPSTLLRRRPYSAVT